MPKAETERWQLADLTIDVGGRTVVRGDATIPLPQLSFKFLLALVHAAPNVLSADELMDQVWTGIFVNAETVKQRAKLLRDALNDDPREPRYFSVRRGVGYQLLCEPVRLDGTARTSAEAVRVPARRRNFAIAAGAALMLALGGVASMAAWAPAGQAERNGPVRVAVLPFDNLSSDPADAFIARSIPEMVLNRLSSVGGLTVIARDSALQSSAANAPPGEAGAQLGANYVVKGSVQRIGKTVRVTCFVVDAGRDIRLWSERFDWPVDRLYALQDRIADRVASSLMSKVGGLGELAPAPVPTRNADAYLAYLQGMALLGRYTVAETDAAAVQFARAVELDPQFADALVALFDAKMQGADLRLDDLRPFRARYQPLLDRALRIRPESGRGLFARAMWSDVPAAERDRLFRRAAQLDPSNGRGLTAYSEFLDLNSVRNTGDAAGEGKALLERVLAVDPLSPRARLRAVHRRWTSIPAGQLETEMARELALDPRNYQLATRYILRRWFLHGETAEAIERIERLIASDPQHPVGPQLAFAFYLDANDPAAARAVAASTPATRAASAGLLAQYSGDWRGAGLAAFGRGGYLFNEYQSWNWPEAVRDYVLRTKEFDRGARAIASRYGFDLDNPRTKYPAQANATPALAHILIAKGERARANRLLAQNVQWIDDHPSYGNAWHMRARAASMMLLGERDVALSNLRASLETGQDVRYWWYVIDRDPVWEPVRGDPRFRAIAEISRKAAAAQRARLDVLRRTGRVPVRPAAANAGTDAT